MNVVHPQISHTAAPCLSVITCKWLVWDEVSENLLMPHIIWLYVSLSNFLWRLDELHDVLKVATGRTKENGDPSVTCSDRGVKSSSSLSHYFFLPWLFFFLDLYAYAYGILLWKESIQSQALWYMASIIPLLGKQRQEEKEFKAVLHYVGILGPGLYKTYPFTHAKVIESRYNIVIVIK